MLRAPRQIGAEAIRARLPVIPALYRIPKKQQMALLLTNSITYSTMMLQARDEQS